MDTFSSPGKFHWNTNQVLGRGSYGVVYRGQLGGAAVAVKKIPLNRLESDADRTELLIKGLDHANLLKFYCQQTIGLFRFETNSLKFE